MAVARQLAVQDLRSAALAEVDPEIAELLGRELDRQRGQIELIASRQLGHVKFSEAISSIWPRWRSSSRPSSRAMSGSTSPRPAVVRCWKVSCATDTAKSPLRGCQGIVLRPTAGL